MLLSILSYFFVFVYLVLFIFHNLYVHFFTKLLVFSKIVCATAAEKPNVLFTNFSLYTI